MTEQIIIELIPDFEQVNTAIEQLAANGQIDQKVANQFKQTTLEANKSAAAIRSMGTSSGTAKKGLDDVAKSAKNITNTFMQGFQEGVIDALLEAGVSAEEFAAKLQDGGTAASQSTQTVKQELRGLVEEIARAKASGQDYGDAYEALVAKAGNLKDAIADVNAEIKTTGSDTKVFDGLISGVQGLAGGFAVAQGTAALFGNESEEIQKTLLKVNAAMAILQGLQSIQNVLQKESAASLLVMNIRQKVSNAQTILTNAALSTNIVVSTGATVAQKALNAAMAANPIGIVVVALAGLVALLANYSSNTREAAAATASLNAALARNGDALDEDIRAYEEGGKKKIAALKASGAVESEIQAATLATERSVAQKKVDALRDLYAERDRIVTNSIETEEGQFEALTDRIKQLESDVNSANTEGLIARVELERTLRTESLKSYASGIEAQVAKAKEGSKRQLELRKQQIAAQTALELDAAGLTEGEKAAIVAKGQQAQLELQADYNKRKIDLEIKGIETRLVTVQEGSEEEFRLNKDLIDRKLESELTSTKLSEEEKQGIIKNYLAQREKLTDDYNKRVVKTALENDISLNNAAIARLNVSNEDKLNLTIGNLERQAEIEVQATNGNADKIKEIYANRDAAIRDTKKKSIDDAVAYEIALADAAGGANRRALERLVANEKKSFADRKAARQALTDIEVDAIDKQIDALDRQYQEKLISDKDYQLQYEQLLDKRKEAEEKTAKEIEDIRNASTQRTVSIMLDVANQIGQTFSLLADIANEQDQQRIAAMQQQLDDAKEAGSITEKEAISRQKRIEAEERKARREAAVREKNQAVFNAFLAIPEAVIKGLLAGGPILAAIYGGIATVNAGIIASRPIPKFGTGKKKSNRYEGFAEVGETGSEIHEVGGRMYLVNKPTMTWVGKDDVIYNPKQTQDMLSQSTPKVKGSVLMEKPGSKTEPIDYKRMGKEIARNTKGIVINIEKDFISESIADGLMKNNYFNQRYSFGN